MADPAAGKTLPDRLGPILKVPVVVLGLGRVGRALASRIAARRDYYAATAGVDLSVVAVADSSGVVHLTSTGEGPGHDHRLRALVAAKARGEALAAAVGGLDASLAADPAAAWRAVDEAAREPPILVDATAADTAALLTTLRAEGWRLVLANKRPLTGSLGQWERVTGTPGPATQVRWEATVASSLPVVTCVRRLAASGAAIRRITGVVSGTVGFVFDRIEAGAETSAALAEAVRLGLAEPDPRADLGGADTRRKALILARSAGFALEDSRVTQEPPYPREWDELPLAAFLGNLDAWSDALRARMTRDAAAGTPLRYGFEVTPEGGTAGLLATPQPLSRAAATDSIVAIEADAFGAHPLVVSGRGGGPGSAAEALLADLLSYFTS